MTKFFTPIICTVAFLLVHTGCRASEAYDTLKAAATNYILFLNVVGSADENTYAAQLPKIIATDCKKVMNGKTAVTSADQFKDQLKGVRKMVGKWTIETLDTLASPESNTCVVRYVLKSKKKGTFITMAILRYNDKGLITEVNEVYNKFEG